MLEKRMLSEQIMNSHKLSNSLKKDVCIGDFIQLRHAFTGTYLEAAHLTH